MFENKRQKVLVSPSEFVGWPVQVEICINTISAGYKMCAPTEVINFKFVIRS